MGLFDSIGSVALGALGGSLFGGGGGGGQQSQIIPQSAIRPGQEGLLDQITQFLGGQIGQRGRVDPSQAGPLGPSSLQRLAFGLPGFGQAQQAFGESLGFDPEQVTQQFQPTADFARQGFREQTIPAIQGALGAQGAARSSGAADILGRAGQNLELGLAGQLGQQQFAAQQAAQQRGFQAPQAALGAAGQIANLGAARRNIFEQQRQFQLNRFRQADPLANPALRLGLQAAGTPTLSEPAVLEGTPGLAQQLLPIGGQLLGAAGQAGGFGNLFSGIGGLFG